MVLHELLCLPEREMHVVSLCGGGGKTTLMYALARETKTILPTALFTTTHIMTPSDADVVLSVPFSAEECRAAAEALGLPYVEESALTPLLPVWEEGSVKDYGEIPCNLGGGPLTIRCKYGNILKNPSNAIYYKCNMESSGVELRINGRAIEHGMFDRVWGEAIHPSQNRFLVQVDLISDNPAALPATKNTKTSFCEADPRLKNLLSWIASYVPAPAKDVDSMELRYVKELTAKREKDPTALRVSREEPVFQKIGLKAKVDLFVGYIDRVTIYEAKAGKTKALDLYQLRMYVDGCALDNKPVDEAVLIAKRHSAEVKELRDILNTLTAPDGRPYNFRLATWDEEGIVIRQSA